MKHLIIVGGGAAGLVCAGFAGKAGLKVTVVETRERPARKILVTGKGRCNVTNNCTPEDFIKNIPTNPKFIYSAAYGFTSQQTMEMFEELGLALKTERGNRVFPESDNARDVVDALMYFSKQGNAEIVNNRVIELMVRDGVVNGIIDEDGNSITGDYVVLATGGLSYPQTGSDGTGYKLAKQAGHTIVKTRPSLIPIICKEKSECADMMGLSLKNITLTLRENGKKKPIYSQMGEMLFTHFGVSGPLALSASAYLKKDLAEYSLSIDMKPALSVQQLDARVLRDFDNNSNKNLGNILGLLLPRGMVSVVAERSGIGSECKVNQITKQQRADLVNTIKNFTLQPVGLRPIEEAVITSGGVNVKEINPKTMESKICKNLFFAGEVIDVDAYTGGFNLQIAFSTAYLASQGVLEDSLSDNS